MARFLAMDWDHDQLHLVDATVGGGSVRVTKAAVWAEPGTPNLVQAEAQGKLLRQRLTEAGMAPAPLLACLGRDRFILKDLRFPAVAPAEEAEVVRFQAVKELTDAPDDVVLDYFPTGQEPDGQRRALTVIARRELVTAYQTLARAAGLKLAGLTPRSFGMAACLTRLAGQSVLTPAIEPADASVAVVAVSGKWAEFAVIQQGKPVFTRFLPAGEGLPGDVRRNLSVFAGMSGRHPVRTLYLAGEHVDLRAVLRTVPTLTVHPLDPFGGADDPALPLARGGFTGAVGVLYAAAEKGPLPINLAQPRQPGPVKVSNRRRLVWAAGLAAAVVMGTGAVCRAKLTALDAEIASEQRRIDDLEPLMPALEEDARRIKALSDWQESGVVWLDELYNLNDRVGDANQLHLSQFAGEAVLPEDPSTARPAKKTPPHFSLKGTARDDGGRSVDDLASALKRTGRYRVEPKKQTANEGPDKTDFPLQFDLPKVEIEKPAPPAKTAGH